MKSRQKTAFLGKIPTVTSEPIIGDKGLWFSNIFDSDLKIKNKYTSPPCPSKNGINVTKRLEISSVHARQLTEERRLETSQPLSSSNFSKLKFRQGQSIFAQFSTAT